MLRTVTVNVTTLIISGKNSSHFLYISAPATVGEAHAQGDSATITFQRAEGNAASYIVILFRRDTVIEVARNKILQSDVEDHVAFTEVEPDECVNICKFL